jgi:hypothetical protein
MTNRDQAAVLYDNLLTVLVRLEIFRDARGEFRRFAADMLDEVQHDPDDIDEGDRMLIDVFNVVLTHLDRLDEADDISKGK